MEIKVPYANLNRLNTSCKHTIDSNLNDCITNSFFINGPWVEQLEQLLEARFAASVAGVGSGTAAQQLSLLALDIGPGDEVLVPSMTFFSTAETVSQVGATPVFVDCELDYYCIDTQDLEAKITSRTRAVMPVDLYGQQADMETIRNICNKYNLFLIQDSAQSFGSLYKDKPVGYYADLAIHSFYPAKNFDCMGDAGAVSGNKKLIQRVKKLRDHGRTEKYIHTEIGWNHRLDGIQASVLCAKHNRVDEWNNNRRTNALYYNTKLSGLPLQLPKEAEYNIHVYNQYVIMTKNRQNLFNFLAEKGVQAGIQFPLGCHQQPAYQKSFALPNTEFVADNCLSLPVWPLMKSEELAYVVSCLEEYFLSK